ncbi:MAG: HugZ family protein [Paraclostridium sp.]
MEKLIQSKKSLMISSLNKEGFPEVSYAPFIMINDKVYIYLSQAANHYYNLSENKNCSIMIIEDESEAKVVFARQRVSFECEANKLIAVEEEIFNKFDEVHSESMMMVLKNLDFDIFKLKLKKGRLVQGFGKAYDVVFNESGYELLHVTGIGHKMK